MAQTPSQIRSFSGPSGRLWTAAVGTAEPANITAAVSADDWTDLGRVSDAGPKISLGKASTNIYTWQSFPFPDRILQGQTVNALSFALMQWGRESITQAIGGVWSGSSPNFVFTPSEVNPDPVAMIAEFVDGAFKWRFIVRKCQNQAALDFVAKGDTAAELPFQMSFLKPDDVDGTPVKSYIIQTGDAAVAS